MKRIKIFGFLFFIILLCLNCGGPDYQIGFVNLEESQLIPSDSVTIAFSVFPEDWQKKGYTIHLLLDQTELKILSRESSVTYSGLTEGAHTVYLFVCDQNGICLKTDGGLAIRNFYSQKQTGPLIDLEKPLLIVHQPQKSEFNGDEGLRILFDFRVLNAELGSEYRVHYNLDGLDRYLEREQPVWIQDARRIGDHKLVVRLETADGELVMGNSYNSITKKFLVVEK